MTGTVWDTMRLCVRTSAKKLRTKMLTKQLPGAGEDRQSLRT